MAAVTSQTARTTTALFCPSPTTPTRFGKCLPGQEDDIGYALAVDSREVSSYNTAEDASVALLTLAREHMLVPSITLLFEEDETP